MNDLTRVLIKEQPECIKNIGSPAVLGEIDRHDRLWEPERINSILSEEAKRYIAVEKQAELNEGLRKAGILVLNKNSVTKYKALYQEQKMRRPDPAGGIIMLAASIISGILSIIEIVLLNAVLALFFGILACVLIPIALEKLKKPYEYALWRRYDFKDYSKMVPPIEVVAAFEKIKKFLPNAGFFIEELEVAEEEFRCIRGKFPPFFGVDYLAGAEQYLQLLPEPIFKGGS